MGLDDTIVLLVRRHLVSCLLGGANERVGGCREDDVRVRRASLTIRRVATVSAWTISGRAGCWFPSRSSGTRSRASAVHSTGEYGRYGGMCIASKASLGAVILKLCLIGLKSVELRR